MNKRGLGRGLSALIPENVQEQDPTTIALDRITTNPHQPRRHFDQQALQELSQSIAQHGLLQPVVLRPHEGGFQLVAGERRFRAAKLAGLDFIPAIVMELTDRQIAEIALVENLQREDLNAIEEAEAYHKLIEEFNLTQDALSKRIGKSRSAIANTLRLMNLAPEVKTMVAQGKISPGHARTLLGLEQEQQVEAAQRIIDSGMSVRNAEKNKGKNPEQKAIKRQDPDISDVQQKLMEYLGTRVTMEQQGNKGKIVIEFYSTDDANRIIQSILD